PVHDVGLELGGNRCGLLGDTTTHGADIEAILEHSQRRTVPGLPFRANVDQPDSQLEQKNLLLSRLRPSFPIWIPTPLRPVESRQVDCTGRFTPLGRYISSKSLDLRVLHILIKNDRKGLLWSSSTLKSARRF